MVRRVLILLLALFGLQGGNLVGQQPFREIWHIRPDSGWWAGDVVISEANEINFVHVALNKGWDDSCRLQILDQHGLVLSERHLGFSCRNLAAEGHKLYASTHHGLLYVNWATGEQDTLFPGEYITDCKIIGERIYTTSWAGDNQFYILNISNNQIVGRWRSSGQTLLDAVAVDTFRNRAYVVTHWYTIYVLDINGSPVQVAQWMGAGSGYMYNECLGFFKDNSAGGGYGLILGNAFGITFLDANPINPYDLPSYTFRENAYKACWDLDIDAKNNLLYISHGKTPKISVWDISHHLRPKMLFSQEIADFGYGLTTSSNENGNPYLYIAARDSGIYKYRDNVSPVTISVPEFVAAPGETVWIPIRLEGVGGREIYSLQFTFSASDPVVSNFHIGDVRGEPVGWERVSRPRGSITTIFLAGATPIVSDTMIVKVRCRIKNTAIDGDISPLSISEVLVNEGMPLGKGRTGRISVVDKFSVQGKVNYYRYFPWRVLIRGSAVDSVVMSLNSHRAATDSLGNYKFDGLLSDNYSLRGNNKEGDCRQAWTSYDAFAVLLHLCGEVPLDGEPLTKLAAEVSGNGSITAFDASLIMQRRVWKIDAFPAGPDWVFLPFAVAVGATDTNWLSLPDSIIFSPLSADTSVDFIGLVRGDVSPSWKPSIAKSVDIVVELVERDYFSVIVNSDVNSADFDFAVKGTIDSVKGPDGFLMEWNVVGDKLLISMAGMDAVSGELVQIYGVCGEGNRIDLIMASINGQPVATSAGGEAGNQLPIPIPSDFRLHQNYPNPFNPETTIEYQLPRESYVTLKIFDLLGREIRVLVDENQGAGTHKVRWDGRDKLGQSVAAGMYFYRIEAGVFTRSMKMLLVK